MAIRVVSTYGECSDCEDPNPNFDPNNPYSSEPECNPKPDGTVVNDCIRIYEEFFAGDQCFSQWIVSWNEHYGIGAPDGTDFYKIYLPTWWRQPLVNRERAWVKKYICIKEYSVCKGGEVTTTTDDGVLSTVLAYRYKMETQEGEWNPFVNVTINYWFGEWTWENPPRRDPENPWPCNIMTNKCECS